MTYDLHEQSDLPAAWQSQHNSVKLSQRTGHRVAKAWSEGGQLAIGTGQVLFCSVLFCSVLFCSVLFLFLLEFLNFN